MVARTILVNASYAPSLLNFRGPLLRRLVAEGHTVHVSAPEIGSDVAAQLRSIGVVAHQVPLRRAGQNPIADIAYMVRIFALVRSAGIDLVLGYTIKPCVWGSLAAKLAGIESVSLVTGLGYAFIDNGNARQALIRTISINLWRLATKVNRTVIFQNRDDLDDFVAAGALVDPRKAKLVAGSGVDMIHFQRTSLPERAKFLMIARLLGNKGVREYAAAATALLAQGCDASFALVGWFDEGSDGISQAEIEQWRRDGVDYQGAFADVRPALVDCSVYVLPSYREGMPRTVLEAMAAGRPIITSDAPGCRQAIIDGESGILVPPRDPTALADAMLRLARDPALREHMAEQAFTRCREVFAVEKVNDTMLEHLGIAHVRTMP